MSQASIMVMQQELNDLDMQISRARWELQNLRNYKLEHSTSCSRNVQAIHAEHHGVKSYLDRGLNQLNMSTYKQAVLETQETAVQPYILQKHAVLCHALHHTELIAKQIQMKQQFFEELEATLLRSLDQIEDFWQPRLLQLNEDIRNAEMDIREVLSKFPEGAQLFTACGEEKECEESPHGSLILSVLSFVLSLQGGPRKVLCEANVIRRYSMSFQPVT